MAFPFGLVWLILKFKAKFDMKAWLFLF